MVFTVFVCHLYFSAKQVGTEMLEIDCHLTDDGEVVVSHDNDLFRATGNRETDLRNQVPRPSAAETIAQSNLL